MHQNSNASTAVLLMTELPDKILIDPLIIVQALGSQKKIIWAFSFTQLWALRIDFEKWLFQPK